MHTCSVLELALLAVATSVRVRGDWDGGGGATVGTTCTFAQMIVDS